MSKWIITTTIETDDEDNYTEAELRQQIELDLNRGDGIWMDTGDGMLIRKCGE